VQEKDVEMTTTTHKDFEEEEEVIPEQKQPERQFSKP
jgi:hypothetical protein